MNSLGPAGLEILRNGLDSVTDLMSLTLVRSARSSLVRNGWDFSTALDAEIVPCIRIFLVILQSVDVALFF